MTVVPGTTTILGLGLFKPHGMLTVEGAVEVGTKVVAVVVVSKMPTRIVPKVARLVTS